MKREETRVTAKRDSDLAGWLKRTPGWYEHPSGVWLRQWFSTLCSPRGKPGWYVGLVDGSDDDVQGPFATRAIALEVALEIVSLCSPEQSNKVSIGGAYLSGHSNVPGENPCS